MSASHLRAAVVQAAPVLFERQSSVEKAIQLTAQAAAEGAQLILLPEAFIPCYPGGLGFGTVVGSRTREGRQTWERYWSNAVDVPGPETAALGEVIAGPLFDQEGILCADLDMGEVSRARFDFDVVGHYARPDVFQLTVNESPALPVISK
jgi:predicted amidohydrolase